MKKLLPVVVVVVVLVALFAVRIAQSKEKAAIAKADTGKEVVMAVKTALVAEKDLPQVLQITGSVRATNEVQVLPKMPGRVTSVRVDVGSVVKAGDVLAVVEAIDMSLRVKLAEAQLQGAKAGLEQAKVQQAQVHRGLQRATALKDKGALSLTDFEQAELGSKLADVGILGAEAQVALADANLAIAQKAFDDTRITTPVAGVITKKNTNIGAMANPMMPAFAVQDQSALKLEGSVPAGYVATLKVGAVVTVLVDELPGRSFPGTVSRVAPSLDADTRRGAIEVSLAPAPDLLPYMFGRAQISFGNTADVVVVPSSAVLSVGGQPSVYVVKHDKATLVHPKLGAKHLDDVVVEAGLVAGDAVVISGDAGLADGASVSVQGT